MMTWYDDAMRTIVELPDEQLEALGNICSQEKASRAEIIRRAVGNYIHGKQSGKGRSAFGLWKKKKINALKYESKFRAEWNKS
jgi:metal-responsive CopG/Arc/MetJ family transcriptional regulator